MKIQRLKKLDPRAHIGYLVGYDSTNIFRIWVPHRGKVIASRDVIFDEKAFFDGRRTEPELIDDLDDLIHKVQITEQQASNERVLEEDEQILDPPEQDGESDAESQENEQAAEQSEPVAEQATSRSYNEREDYGLAKLMEEAFHTPPPTEPDQAPEAVLAVHLPVAEAGGVERHGKPEGSRSETQGKLIGDRMAGDRFEDFVSVPVETAVHGAFVAGRKFKPARTHKRDLPEPPKTFRDLEGHPYKADFRKAQEDHMASHKQMGSFQEVPRSQARGQQVLSCMWVFTYKTDKHGYLVKCKARLVVCGNQQAKGDLPTRATTLASMSFRALMAIAAEYDLELEQMDAINAFVNCDLDELVFMRMPPGFEKYGTVLRLKKALYGLRRSPLLWQRDLTETLQDLGFSKIPQEPCVMQKGGVIVFFFVDDIIWAYRMVDKALAKEAMAGLQRKYKMSLLGDPKWFLGIHIIRDRAKRSIWLSQEAYIDKIAHQFDIALDSKLPETPMAEEELLPASVQADRRSIELYMKKVGCILFAAISTRPDVAFAASRLARFNQNPDDRHHMAADRAIQYLYRTRCQGIRLGGTQAITTFLCASDASFADNTVDRKSSQGYVMMLFGGPIAWRASKQATVTTSSTEAELLALSETAKEAIFASRLLKQLQVQIDRPLLIECDNTQTIRLLTEDMARLTTKLRHVDIHQHWLRQECQAGRIQAKWVPTRDMMADGLTKSLPKQKHEAFMKLLRMEDISARIAMERRMDTLKDQLKDAKARKSNEAPDQEVKLGFSATIGRKKQASRAAEPQVS
ncbi:polyprotein [Purpureocillium lilacinum]|uniref:Polyprotein n=1 Tax=Purpureocillium lilacinum TaxID=33203 RepID=A0A179FJ79_PURLI|nr:polyprotein [Purpureocillium lilacinum]